VAGGQEWIAPALDQPQEAAELDQFIAADTGVGSSAGLIGPAEIINDLELELLPHIHRADGDA